MTSQSPKGILDEEPNRASDLSVLNPNTTEKQAQQSRNTAAQESCARTRAAAISMQTVTGSSRPTKAPTLGSFGSWNIITLLLAAFAAECLDCAKSSVAESNITLPLRIKQPRGLQDRRSVYNITLYIALVVQYTSILNYDRAQ